MQITDIRVRKLFDDGPMKAIVSVTFDGQLAVHDIKVINARDKFFIVMPSRKNPDDTYRDIVHPINAQFRAELESAVIAAYEAEKANAFIRWIEETNKKMGLPDKFDVVQDKDIDQMITWAKKEANPLYPVPVVWARKDFRRLIESIRK